MVEKMSQRNSLIFFILIAMTLSASAQWISPGPLSRVHSDLEGMENCTECHNLGAKITSQKCLTCHGKIELEMQEQRGYHFLNRDQTCTECHHEHRGSDYALIQLDEKTFDHSKFGFILDGEHQKQSCTACHQTSGSYSGLEKACLACHLETNHARMDEECSLCHNTNSFRPSTFRHKDEDLGSAIRHPGVGCRDCHIDGLYRGTEKACTACHPDEHKGQLSDNCLECHQGTSFLLPKFDHNVKTAFKLSKPHSQLACETCHPDKLYKKNATLCSSCHANPHKEETSDDCLACHSQDAFTRVTFKHKENTFHLASAHNQLDCNSCHSANTYQETAKTCISCHDDEHKEAMTETCEACHTVQGFKPSQFKHEKPHAELTGAHLQQSCRACHDQTSVHTGTEECSVCHTSEHKGELNQPCSECHTTRAFKPATFKHKPESFQAQGKHQKTECVKCHLTGQFEKLNSSCASCHTDVHQGKLGKACSTCHDYTSWKNVQYDHNAADYLLRGRHLDLKCEECHQDGTLSGMPSNCYNCHQDPHQKRFGTDCESCHDEDNWANLRFNHDQTGYTLQGMHEQLTCANCHPQDRVTGTPDNCYGCHRRDYEAAVEPNHRAAKFGIECEECHKNSDLDWPFGYWEEHESIFPRRTSSAGHHAAFTCSECHPTNTDYRKYNCLACHERSETDAAHSDLKKYRYQNSKCLSCHPYGEIEQVLPEE
jgi:hypothetical protein